MASSIVTTSIVTPWSFNTGEDVVKEVSQYDVIIYLSHSTNHYNIIIFSVHKNTTSVIIHNVCSYINDSHCSVPCCAATCKAVWW